MKNIWDKNKTVNGFTVGSAFSEGMYEGKLEKLHRYDYEDYDTYQVVDSFPSKVFVKEGRIYSYQAGEDFTFDGVNYIGKNIQELMDAVGNGEWRGHQGGRQNYYDYKHNILVWDDKGTILWVVICDYPEG